MNGETSPSPRRAAVIGATGPTGIHLARELAARGVAVRAVARRSGLLDKLFSGTAIEPVVADATGPGEIRRAVEGCDRVVSCVGLPSDQMDLHLDVARAVAGAARDAGARCLQVSSYWSYLPHRGTVVSEAHPRSGGHLWFRRRREAEEIYLAQGAAVVHLPDFFGPHVHTSAVQLALDDVAAGRPMSWIGGREVAREIAFVPDAMRIVADLVERDAIWGERWGLPGCAQPTADELAAIAAAHLGRPVKVRAAPPWLLRLMAWFVPSVRPVVPLAPHYARSVRYDTAKLAGLLGEVRTTPLAEAVGVTLDWIAGRAGGADAQ